MSIPDEKLARWTALPRPGTPGPWRKAPTGDSDVLTGWMDEDGDYLVVCEHAGPDADFLAFAPETREAIDELVAEVRRLREECDRARIAFLELSEGRP